MIKGILAFFTFISALLLLLVYFAGDYHVNFDYLTGGLSGKAETERDLIIDQGKDKENSYLLRLTNLGQVEFHKDDQGDQDYRSFKIEAEDVKTIQEKMDSTGVFKVFSLDRNYCLNRYQATIYFDFGWINKAIEYSNCVDDPTEIRNFRSFLYKFLGLSLQGT